jgi:hypothetical protein
LIYDGTNYIELGLTGADYVNPSGQRFANPHDLNRTGQAIGTSRSESGFRHAWLYDGTSTIRIGLYNGEYAQYADTTWNEPRQLNHVGQVIGTVSMGNGAWFYDGTSTIKVGLFDSVHTAGNGETASNALMLNDAGQVVGRSRRYNDLEWNGYSTWFYDSGTTVKIGLYDAEHTRQDGWQESDPYEIHEAGNVIGESRRFDGLLDAGWSAWVFDGMSTVKIGLYDAEHARRDGYRNSYTLDANDAAHVSGQSQRFNGLASVGWSAWFYDGIGTTKIGLYDAEHTRQDGWQDSRPFFINDSDQIVGRSLRYVGQAEEGRTAWFYDAASDQTVPIVLGSELNGYAYTSPVYLGQDGLTLGEYNLFDGPIDLGLQPFYFRFGEIPHDLGALIGGDFLAHEWTDFGFTRVGDSLQFVVDATDIFSQVFQYTVTIPHSQAGDFNNDGSVDAADYVVWRKTDGTQEAYDTWRANFGQTAGSGSFADAAVPEPISLVLLLFAFSAVHVIASNRARSARASTNKWHVV